MNREIKFRMYHKDFGMSKPVSLQDLSLSTDARWIELNPIIMQYTGLKDKNGKDIYEGDVLLLLDPSWHKDIRIPVIYDRGGYRAEFGTLYRACNIGVEVIGNIYENPELLK